MPDTANCFLHRDPAARPQLPLPRGREHSRQGDAQGVVGPHCRGCQAAGDAVLFTALPESHSTLLSQAIMWRLRSILCECACTYLLVYIRMQGTTSGRYVSSVKDLMLRIAGNPWMRGPHIFLPHHLCSGGSAHLHRIWHPPRYEGKHSQAYALICGKTTSHSFLGENIIRRYIL